VRIDSRPDRAYFNWTPHLLGETTTVMTKRVFVKPLRIVAGIAFVVFFFMPLGAFPQVVLCAGSLLVALICSATTCSVALRGVSNQQNRLVVKLNAVPSYALLQGLANYV
jgi:hypothetical protein